MWADARRLLEYGNGVSGLASFEQGKPQIRLADTLGVCSDLLGFTKHHRGLIPAFATHEEYAECVDADLDRPLFFDLLAQIGDRPVKIAFLCTLLGASNAWVEAAEVKPGDQRSNDDYSRRWEDRHRDP